jgi:uncharacterized protein YrzB (UPF0473 family)
MPFPFCREGHFPVDLYLTMRYNEHRRNNDPKQGGEPMSDDYGSDFITIVDEEGNEYELEVLDYIDYNGKTYGAFLPADIPEDDPDFGMVILQVVEDENGMDAFDVIEDDEEEQDVYERFMIFLFGNEDEEDEEE